MLRKAIIPSLILIAGVGGWLYYEQQPAVAAVEVAPETTEVTREDIEETVLASGVVESSNLVSVGAQVSGRIETVAVAVGDVVAAGDVIATIDSSDQETALLMAQAAEAEINADIAAQNATLTSLQAEAVRQEDLRARGINSQSDVETADAALAVGQANLQSLQAKLSQAELDLETAQTALDRTQITAPIDGTIVAIVNGEGTTVNASSSSPTIVKIADLTEMHVTASVSEADIAGVTKGLTARFTLPGLPDRTFEAELDAVAPAPASIATSDDISTDEAIYYEAQLTVPNEDGALRIGMTAEVTIVLQSSEDTLSIPLAAVGDKAPDGTSLVNVWDDRAKTAKPRNIRLGMANDDTVEVVDGLEEGERVVMANAVAAPAAAGGNRSGGPGMRPGGMGF